MGGDAGDMLKQVAGYGVGALGALTSLKGGGLQNYFINRQRMLEDPAFRATLVDSPFTAGVFGVGHGEAPTAGGMPAAGGVAAPGDVRYLPTGGHWYPALAPLDYESQAKAEQNRANMIGLTSADPTIRAQSKLAIGVPLAGPEIIGPGSITERGRQIVGAAGPGSQVRYKTGFGDITVGSPYIAGQYLDPEAARIAALKTGQIPIPGTAPGETTLAPEQRPEIREFKTKAESDAVLQPGEHSEPTGRTVADAAGIHPTWHPVKDLPSEKPLPTGPEKPAPAAAPARRAAPAQPAQPAATPPPPPPVPPSPPPQDAAPSPAPAPEAPPPPPPTPPKVPPHEVLRQNPDGTFSPLKPAPAPAPRAEATPAEAPPLLAAATPPLFAFPGVSTPAAGTPAPPVMVASAAPPYQLVPGSELSGVASGAPPAPAEERGAPRPPVTPAPAAALPYPQPTPGARGTATTPAGIPTGAQTWSEEQPLAGGGTKSFQGTTEYGLEVEKRRKEIDADIQRRFGDVRNPEKLYPGYAARGAVNAILDEYTPEERAKYLGYVEPYLKRFWFDNDPRYQRFLQLNGQIAAALSAGGVPDKMLGDMPTGLETRADSYEAALRSAADRADTLITAEGVFANAHPDDLTPEKQQKIVVDYISRAGSAENGIHYGPYPWDAKTGVPISSQTTTTSAPPTTTTLFPVDRRYTVAPPR